MDDAFIIVNSLDRTYRDFPEDSVAGEALTIPRRLALAFTHSGVSITITSFTDLFAFLIGATTVLPALSSFCIYAAIGILADFILQVSVDVCVRCDSMYVRVCVCV